MIYQISFSYNGETINISNETVRDTIGEVVDWLFDKGYTFVGPIHNVFGKKLLSIDDIKNNPRSDYYLSRMRQFYKLKNADKYIQVVNKEPAFEFIKEMLVEFGVSEDSIKSVGFEKSRIKKFGEIETDEEDFDLDEEITKMTFIEAAQLVLKENENNPMSVNEIWDIISDRDLVETEGTTPKATLNSIMLKYSNNSGVAKKYKTQLFTIVETNPVKFILINPDLEVQNIPDDEFDNEIEKIKVYQQNPFKQAICVLGESGAGKSVTIETILENEGHNFEFIIPTATTTGLLSQFSPSKSGYIASRLGKMLIEASKNSQTLYTAVFDEMHKSNVIEMINDELLQAISTKRNRGRRFISLDDDTAEIYQKSELETERGNLLIPDNFGFIFISSKPRVIANNADFFNRVDIVLLKSYQEETIETTEQLLSNKLDDEEKMKLASTRND